jgi:Protein of unknown function (DUF2501)
MRSSKRATDFSLRRICTIAAVAAVTVVQFAAPPVWAQLSGVLGSGQSAGSNALGGLGGSLPSVTKAGPGNTAGVLQYCIQNNYLSDTAAGPAKNALLTHVPGSSQSSDFTAGSSGLLQTGNGQSFNLGGDSGGIKSQMTHKVCDMVLQHAKSLL